MMGDDFDNCPTYLADPREPMVAMVKNVSVASHGGQEVPREPIVESSDDGSSNDESINDYEKTESDSELENVERIPSTSGSHEEEPSRPGGGFLRYNPSSCLEPGEIVRLRVLYKIPTSIDIRLPRHERVDWNVPGYISMYEQTLIDGLRFPIPRLVREVLDHYLIAPTQLMPNVWKLLMSLECLCMRHDIEFGVKDLLYSYYLKEHDKERGRFMMMLRHDRQHLITELRSFDKKWKDVYFFVKGELVFGPSGAEQIPLYWQATDLTYNKAFPGLLAEERTQRILLLQEEKRSFKSLLSDSSLRKSHLWSQVKEIQQEERMKGDFKVPSAKEIKEKRAAIASKKRKRPITHGNLVTESVPVTPTPLASPMAEPSQKTDFADGDEMVRIVLPATASVYSDPTTISGVVPALLLPEDQRRLNEIGVVRAAEWCTTRMYQAMSGGLHLQQVVSTQEKRNQDLANTNSQLRKQLAKAAERENELRGSRAVVTNNLQSARAELESVRSALEEEKKENANLKARLDNVASEAVLKTRAELMEEFKAGKQSEWDPDEDIEFYKTFMTEQGEEDGFEGEELNEGVRVRLSDDGVGSSDKFDES